MQFPYVHRELNPPDDRHYTLRSIPLGNPPRTSFHRKQDRSDGDAPATGLFFTMHPGVPGFSFQPEPMKPFIALLPALFVAACAGTPPKPSAMPARAHPAAAPALPTTAPAASHPREKTPVREEKPAIGDNIFFATGSVRIDEQGRRLLREVVATLKADPRTNITLVGHTDDLGSTEFNIALAQRRVEAVADELAAMGASPRQLRRISYGNEAAPRVCTTPACRQDQRRVEIRYSE